MRILILDSTVLKKINFSKYFPFKCIRKQLWPWRKVGQGQPRIVIWTNLAGLTSPMLHTKHTYIWFWRRFLKGFYNMGISVILVMWSRPFEHIFNSRVLRSLHMKFEFDWPSRCLKMLTDGRRSHWYTIRSPMSLWPKIVSDSPSPQDTPTHQIWNSFR